MTNVDFHTRHIRAFVALTEEGSFSRAAKRLGTTQPNISQSMRALEEHLGFRLLKRSHDLVEVSSDGMRLLGRCRELLAHTDRLWRISEDLRTNPQRDAKLGMTLYSGLPERSRLLERFFDHRPSSRLNLVSAYTSTIYEELLKGAIDLAILIGPTPSRSFEHLVIKSLTPEVIVPIGSPFSQSVQIHANELAGVQVATFERARSPELFDASIEKLVPFGPCLIYPEDQTAAGLLKFAKDGHLVLATAFPWTSWVSDQHLAQMGMTRRPITGIDSSMALMLARPTNATPAGDDLWSFAQSWLGNSGH